MAGAAYTHAHLLALRFSAVLAWGAISAQISPTPAAKQQVKLLQLLKTAKGEPSQDSSASALMILTQAHL
jgi:hypothetical protein